MITINLLPEELKIKTKSEAKGVKFTLKESHFTYLLPAFIVILICFHLILGLLAGLRGAKVSALSKKLDSLAAQRKELDAFMQIHSAFSEDAVTIQNLIKQRIDWAPKLNKLSLNLPSGVWFSELAVNEKEFVLKGAVVSIQKDGMGLIRKFLSSLQNDKDFSADFSSLELTSVQNRTIGTYEVSDFVITGPINKK